MSYIIIVTLHIGIASLMEMKKNLSKFCISCHKHALYSNSKGISCQTE